MSRIMQLVNPSKSDLTIRMYHLEQMLNEANLVKVPYATPNLDAVVDDINQELVYIKLMLNANHDCNFKIY